MGRRLRFIPTGGALVEITCRTIQGRYLMRPSGRVREMTLGVLARAARLYPVEVHAFVFMSNHYHLLVSVHDALRLAQFMGYLNSNLAREICRLTGWRDKVWSRRYQAILVSDEPAAQMARLKYLLAHGMKEGLVDRPTQWAGAHSVSNLLNASPVRGKWLNRSRWWAARQDDPDVPAKSFLECEMLDLAPLPCWQDRDASTIIQWVSDLLSNLCVEFRPRPSARTHSTTSNNRAVNVHPQERPLRLKVASAPMFHCISRTVRAQLWVVYRQFAEAYRKASTRFRNGDLLAPFPEGSFRPPLLYSM